MLVIGELGLTSSQPVSLTPPTRSTAYAHALLHLATESNSFEVRRAISSLVASSNSHAPKLTHLVLREGIRSWLMQTEKAKAVVKPVGDDQDAPVDHTPRLRSLLLTLSTFDDEVPTELRQELVSQLLVLAHHPKLGPSDAGIWVDLLLHAKVAPDELISSRADSLLDLIWHDASTSPSSTLFAEAAYRAATTLALILPATIVPLLFAQFENDLDPSKLAFIGSTEYGVWATPEGTPFVDPLAAAKPKAPVSHKNSKEREIELWEAELREALARKKPVVATLSKQDRQLLERQLAKEGEIRAQMAEALGRLRRGFKLLLCLINSKAELVKEYLATMVNDVLKVIVSRPATLVADEAFTTYQASSSPTLVFDCGLMSHHLLDRLSETSALTASASRRSLSGLPSCAVSMPRSSPRTTSPNRSRHSSPACCTACAISRSSLLSMQEPLRTPPLLSARSSGQEGSDLRSRIPKQRWSSSPLPSTLSPSTLVNVRPRLLLGRLDTDNPPSQAPRPPSLD